MNKPRWRDLFEALGVTAVVASLVFVGFQLEQDRLIAQSELGSGSSTMLVEIYESMFDRELSEVYAKMLETPGDMSVGEMLQINNRLEAITEIFFRECYLMGKGVFTECRELARLNIPLFFGNKYAQVWWEGSKMKPRLPDWIDEEIAKLDPDTEMRRIEAIRKEL